MQNLQTCMHLFSALENENNKLLSRVWLFMTDTMDYIQSMEFSRPEY